MTNQRHQIENMIDRKEPSNFTESEPVTSADFKNPHNIKIRIATHRVYNKRVNEIKNVWNNFNSDFIKKVKKLTIKNRLPKGDVGVFFPFNHELKLSVSKLYLVKGGIHKTITEAIKSVFLHEIGHANYNVQTEEKKNEWYKAIKDTTITTYLERFKRPIVLAEKKLAKKPIVGYLIWNLQTKQDMYANETFAEFTNLANGVNSDFDSNIQEYEKVKQSYKKIFGKLPEAFK